MRKTGLLLMLILSVALMNDANARFLFFGKKKEVKKPVVAAQPPASKSSVKPYAQVITKAAKTSRGFFKVHKVDDKYYFEIPDSLLGRDMLVVSRIANSAAESRKGFLGYAGDEINENQIRFEMGPNNKLFIKSISYAERSQDSTGMFFAVQRSNMQPIVGAFEVKAFNRDTVSKKQNVVIDVTDFVNSDNNVLFFDDQIKKALSLGNMVNDRSYIDTIKAFPMNVEIRTVKTYMPKPQSPFEPVSNPFTYELNTSVVLLPKVPMQARYFDPRVGYFVTGYTDFDKNPQGVERVRLITRWRLEPKPEDVEKYKRGELVEPKKPIVFYIDPATPKKWVPYLKQGVNDWQKAFEKAGFKNAIYALDAPKDSTWSLEDANHSAVVYKPSDIANASGPHVHDPRSGEILETHINWYHNVMQLLHDWYFVQAAAIDTAARKMQFSDELMGQLIRFVSSHEVGHTLGLRHNFGSSCTVPVEKLRDKAWVEANGHTPSIMDYARFNYVAQPEDHIGQAGIFPRIGVYDEWAIEWGYRWFPQFKKPQEEVAYMNKWVIEKLKSDKRFTFGTETDSNDPRNQSEDLGDNAMLASEYGIRNLKRIVPNLMQWCKEPDKDYSSVAQMYNQIMTQYMRYMGHVTRNIAGIYTTPKTVEQEGAVYEYVSKPTQKEAVAFLSKQLFTTPQWLINNDLIVKAGVSPIKSLNALDKLILSRIVSDNTFDKMLQNQALNGESAYTPQQLLTDLDAVILNDLKGGNPDIYRRNLQNAYVDALISMIKSNSGSMPGIIMISMGGTSTPDGGAVARQHLINIKTMLSRTTGSVMTKAHVMNMLSRIDQALDPKK